MIEPVAREKITPRGVEEISETLRRASVDGLAVRIEGGNTLAGMGFPLDRCDITIGLRELNALIAHEVHDLTCALSAGMTLRDVDRALETNAQFVPLDAPQRSRATVGGTMASGWRGPRRHLYGSPRELLLGIDTVLADGTPVRAGGMVVKNVAGYDMGKLYTGSFGAPGVITRANFKTLPSPQLTRAVVARLPERTRARAVAHLYALSVPPAAALLIEGFRNAITGEDGIDGRLFVLLQGSPNVVDRATRDLRSALGKAGVPEASIVEDGAFTAFTQILDATVECVGERSATYRIFALPAEAESRAANLRDIAVR
ncbi:MAG: FAD-binding oxidoreductase, partial [Candidatus Eremiobacteraeota bacterium]|nr:FAD-binding oxidoreductase [Candidatus Eremiobacteraeota bacterium]